MKERQLSARCRTRYEFALQFFFGFLPFVVGAWAADWEARDSQVGEFMEAMWAEGEPKSLAGDILSALQWHYGARKVLNGSWRKFGTWTKLEPSAHALPLPVGALFAALGVALEMGHPFLAISIFVGFHACTY